MGVHALNLKSLMENLDNGRVAEAFQQELRRCVADCEDRPADPKPRSVVIQLNLEPVAIDNGLDSVNGKFVVTSTVPKRRSKQYNFAVRRGNQLVFNDLSDGNIHQGTLPLDNGDDDE